MALDSSKGNSTGWGGARAGAGRPKGSMNQASKDRKAAKEAYQQRIMEVADKLFNSQYNLAVGEQYLFWKHKVGNGEKQRYVTEIVDDIEVIKKFINEDLDYSSDEYYYISTKPANNSALDSMLDRSFGKAENSLDLTSKGEQLGVSLSAEQADQLIRARANRSNL